MDSKKLLKDIFMQIFVGVIIQCILYGITFAFSFLAKEKINIFVCTSTRDDAGYSTSINIKNYQKNKSVPQIVIWSDEKIDTNTINYSDLEVIKNKIVLKNIPPLFDGTIILHSSEALTKQNTQFETVERNVVLFANEQKEEIYYFWESVIKNMITFIIVYIVMGVLIHLITEKQVELYKQRIEQIEHSQEAISKRYDLISAELKERKQEIKNNRESNLRLKIFLHRKLEHYAKELDFYKSLIGGIVNQESKEDICYQITKELKTFKTLDKINATDLELDSLKLSQLEINGIKNEDTKELT